MCRDVLRDATDVHLLSQQLVVHLDSLHLFVALLQPLVVLAQLADVVTGFGQDASFTLRNTERTSAQLFFLTSGFSFPLWPFHQRSHICCHMPQGASH